MPGLPDRVPRPSAGSPPLRLSPASRLPAPAHLTCVPAAGLRFTHLLSEVLALQLVWALKRESNRIGGRSQGEEAAGMRIQTSREVLHPSPSRCRKETQFWEGTPVSGTVLNSQKKLMTFLVVHSS